MVIQNARVFHLLLSWHETLSDGTHTQPNTQPPLVCLTLWSLDVFLPCCTTEFTAFSHSAVSRGWMIHDLPRSNTSDFTCRGAKFWRSTNNLLQRYNKPPLNRFRGRSIRRLMQVRYDRTYDAPPFWMYSSRGRSKQQKLDCLALVKLSVVCVASGLGGGTFKHRVPSTGDARLKWMWNARC